MADIKVYLQKMVDRFADPRLQLSLKGFNRTLLFKFTDTNEDWVIRTTEGQGAVFEQVSAEAPEVTVITTTDILAGVMDKKVNGMTAYMQKKIQVKGAMEDLMKLQKLML